MEIDDFDHKSKKYANKDEASINKDRIFETWLLFYIVIIVSNLKRIE